MALVITSHARVRGARKGPAFLAVAMLMLNASAAADVIINARDGMVALDADAVTVRSILAALATAHVVDVTASIPLQSEITLKTAPEPLARLLKRLLRPYSYTLIEHHAASGLLPRLHVFSDENPGAPTAWAARSLPAGNAIDRAIAALADPDADVREEAVLTLADSQHPDVVSHFVSTLGDPSPDVREAARAALEDMDTAMPAGYEIMPSSRQRN